MAHIQTGYTEKQPFLHFIQFSRIFLLLLFGSAAVLISSNPKPISMSVFCLAMAARRRKKNIHRTVYLREYETVFSNVHSKFYAGKSKNAKLEFLGCAGTHTNTEKDSSSRDLLAKRDMENF